MNWVFLNEGLFFPLRERRQIEILAKELGGVKSILDVGCGNGRIGLGLKQRLGAKVIGIDKILQPKVAIEARVYGGERLPYKDNSFDVTLLVDVVHHEVEQIALLKEARRVARKFVLVKDHYFDNALDWWLLRTADEMGNRDYGVQLPFTFLSLRDWKDLGDKANFRQVRLSSFRDPILGFWFKQVILKLEK